MEIPGYRPSANCSQTWGKAWPHLDARTLGVDGDSAAMHSVVLLGVLDMLDDAGLARTCSVSIWWRRTARRRYFTRILRGRRSARHQIHQIHQIDNDSLDGLYFDDDVYDDDVYGYGGMFPRSRAGSF